MLCSMAEIDTSTSQEHCTVQVTTPLLTTLLPDRVTFIFPSREIVTALGNRIYFFFISTKDVSFPQFAFTLLKMFAKF